MTAKRPWWLISANMPLLKTTLREDHRGDGKLFIIEGKPEIKSLSWVIYGPLLAVGVTLAIGALAWLMDIKTADRAAKLLFACLLGLTPILVWVAGAFAVNKLSQQYLRRLSDEGAVETTIRFDLAEQTFQLNRQAPVPFSDISNFRLVTDAGVYYNPREEGKKLHNLVMDTNQGRITVLPKNLGGLTLKLQLINQFKALAMPESE